MTPSTCSAQKTQVDSNRENKDESNMFKENINKEMFCECDIEWSGPDIDLTGT